jgi:hypothetical protein
MKDDIRIEDVKTLAQQHEYHRMITKKWNAMPELPSSIWEMPFPEIGAPWWQIPGGYDPESYQTRKHFRCAKIAERQPYTRVMELRCHVDGCLDAAL